MWGRHYWGRYWGSFWGLVSGQPIITPPFVPSPVSDPQVTLSISLDGGNTFSPQYSRSLGQTGQFQARLVWNNLGTGRDAVIDVFGSDPVRIVLTGANFDAEVLNH